LYKLINYAGYDARTGPHIFPIEANLERSIGHIKMARELPASIEQYLRSAAPIPGKTQLLIDAMGSGEYYGSNVNGDYFPEEALRHPGPEYGYETFQHYAYPFKHHVNKDPARAYGEKVTLSAYDPGMHRVLLIVRVDDAKCQDILGDLAANRYWDVSMGCRVPWDRCSVCGNRAKNRAEYCPHLRYQMNKILPDGRRVFAFNDKPKFFDISFVTIGAEKASHVLKKVAHDGCIYEIRPSSAELGESFYAKYAAAEKASSARKTADLTKEVPAGETKIEGVTPSDQAKVDAFMEDAGAVKSTEPALPPALLNQLTGFPLREIFATLAALGIDLRPQEFQRIILVKQGARALADKLAAHRLVFDEHRPGPMPKWARELEHLSEHDVSEKVALQLRPYIADRSCYPEILAARLERMEKRGEIEGYNRDSQWYPMTNEQRRLSSGMPGVVPASLALAAGFMVFRRAFPQLVEKAPSPVRAIAKHPWMLPLLISAGVGATVAAQQLGAPRDLEPHGTGAGLDAKNGPAYHQRKTAGITGLIPLAYIHAGVQQQRSQAGSRGGFERLASVAAPHDRATHHLTKFGGLMSDPALDASILESVQRLARRMKEI
jgi:hypothetical protein